MQHRLPQSIGTGLIVLLMTMATVSSAESLDIVIKSAPIVPHGLIAGKPLDITLSFVDLNPEVPGIDLKKGATAKVYLPPQIVNLGYQVTKPGDIEGCKPPVLEKCSSGGILNGWPQSPLLPLNTIDYNADDHTLTLTAIADAPPYSIDYPGAKLIHLFTFGFQNPDEAGDYPVKLEIQPDPSQSTVLSGVAMIKISDTLLPSIAMDSTQAPHVKGPMYRNTMFQKMKPGDTSHSMSANLWDASHQPIVGATVSMTDTTNGTILSADGAEIGNVSIDTPKDAKGFVLMSAPSFPAKTGLAGFATGRLVMALRTARHAKGVYNVEVSLNGGNSIAHHITVE